SRRSDFVRRSRTRLGIDLPRAVRLRRFPVPRLIEGSDGKSLPLSAASIGKPVMQTIAELSRREMLRRSACGFGSLALAGLAAEAAPPLPAAESGRPRAARLPHHSPRAKRVIFIFMQGGPSQVDTFDDVPRLAKENG